MEGWREPSIEAVKYNRIVIIWIEITDERDKERYMGIFSFNGITNRWISVHGNLPLSLEDILYWYPLPTIPEIPEDD